MEASIAALQTRIDGDARSLSLPQIQPGLAGERFQDGAGSDFAAGLRQIIDGVNEQDRAAGEKMAAVDSGRSDDLVGAMLASQQASLSFTMLMQARNKIVGAMEDLIKLQL
ncbi:MAG TPA: flagellar hook-basal body complex protein FliE [Povalibacter sp.]|uniref:flagellar hook-basal body complex protein FliE n=1 Tax=Povalibacter sp. TaxID=1962978 RepID=UPI002CC3DB87|nr:flagellar hook-basal body complex protein FliE [Povalibacter sp.]HMN43157.1 flagellar hook-basal body complex protein FliE [Povalibacter sp.]